jgi:hypothetical protein
MAERTRGWGLLLAVASIAACSQTRKVARVDAERSPEEPAEAREVPPDRGRPPVPATPAGLLAPGGAKRVQQALAAEGFLDGPRGGDEIDDRTASALRRFQQQRGLAATGFPDRETLRRLGLDPKDVYERDDG